MQLSVCRSVLNSWNNLQAFSCPCSWIMHDFYMSVCIPWLSVQNTSTIRRNPNCIIRNWISGTHPWISTVHTHVFRTYSLKILTFRDLAPLCLSLDCRELSNRNIPRHQKFYVCVATDLLVKVCVCVCVCLWDSVMCALIVTSIMCHWLFSVLFVFLTNCLLCVSIR